MVPGDIFTVGNEIVVRMQPLVAPVMHEINVYTHYFFVPYRILMTTALGDDGEWTDYISGGEDGNDASTLPTWQPTSYGAGTLWDYMGFPPTIDPDGAYPVDFPKRAYNMIWNQYYRDELLQTEIDITTAEGLRLRNWEKDRFTSSRTSQLLGTAPTIPITISGDGGGISLINDSDATVRNLYTRNQAVGGRVDLDTQPSARS